MAKIVIKSVKIVFSYNERGRSIYPVYEPGRPLFYFGPACTYGKSCPYPHVTCNYCKFSF